METKSTLELFLNGITIQHFTVYFILGMIGVISSMLIEIYRTKARCKNRKESFHFSTGYWIKDNGFRLILSVISVILGILFTKDLLDIELNNFTALLAGFNSDKIIESFKTKINLNK